MRDVERHTAQNTASGAGGSSLPLFWAWIIGECKVRRGLYSDERWHIELQHRMVKLREVPTRTAGSIR